VPQARQAGLAEALTALQKVDKSVDTLQLSVTER